MLATTTPVTSTAARVQIRKHLFGFSPSCCPLKDVRIQSCHCLLKTIYVRYCRCHPRLWSMGSRCRPLKPPKFPRLKFRFSLIVAVLLPLRSPLYMRPKYRPKSLLSALPPFPSLPLLLPMSFSPPPSSQLSLSPPPPSPSLPTSSPYKSMPHPPSSIATASPGHPKPLKLNRIVAKHKNKPTYQVKE